MTPEKYFFIIHMFMVIMPIELIVVGMFTWACISNEDTNQPAFWYALMCIGVLVPEIIRGFFILTGEIPPHCKQLQLWITELFPFGGFIYEILKRHFCKVWSNFHND